ncbi:MAG: DUF2911 domain-containing protein [Myxococcales bacterium]|nr:DUF2911 domain-containing protein [Myxococcales bacterium]
MSKSTWILALAVTLLAADVPRADAKVAAPPARGDDSKRKSKNGKADGTVGGVRVLVQYGRPEVRGRKVFGELVSWGKLWRAGANEATTVTFYRDAKVEGRKIKAGSYALFAVPGKKKWVFVFNKQPKQWGAYKHDKGKDALRVTVKPKASKHTEALTFDVGKKKVTLRWAKVSVGFRVSR